MPKRLLLDAPSLVYRAFFALPKEMTNKKGQSVNAARGFLDMLATMITERKPDDLVVALDADWRPRSGSRPTPATSRSAPRIHPSFPRSST